MNFRRETQLHVRYRMTHTTDIASAVPDLRVTVFNIEMSRGQKDVHVAMTKGSCNCLWWYFDSQTMDFPFNNNEML